VSILAHHGQERFIVVWRGLVPLRGWHTPRGYTPRQSELLEVAALANREAERVTSGGRATNATAIGFQIVAAIALGAVILPWAIDTFPSLKRLFTGQQRALP
jgi:hypothetical protein